MIGIYKITNIKNGFVYIGQSINIEKRWEDHIYMLERHKHENDRLQKSWNKHGRSNFVFSIIEECEREKLNDRETYWLNQFKPNVYNLGNTGNIQTMSDEQKEKISKSLKRYYQEHPYSEEMKKHLSQVSRGRKLKKELIEARNKKLHEYWKNHTSPRKGKELPKETKEKMSSYWKTYFADENNKQRMCKPVNQFTKDGKFIKRFNSLIEASKEIGVSKETITKVCRQYKRFKSVHWFIFKYAEEL